MADNVRTARVSITADERKLLTVLSVSGGGLSCHQASEQSGFDVKDTYRLLAALNSKAFTVKEPQERTPGLLTVAHFASDEGEKRLALAAGTSRRPRASGGRPPHAPPATRD